MKQSSRTSRARSRRGALFPIAIACGAVALALSADGREKQENEKALVGKWQAERALVEFADDGTVRMTRDGRTVAGTYEVSGDWLFAKTDGEGDISGEFRVEGDRLTFDGKPLRRLRPLAKEQLIGVWEGDQGRARFFDDGRIEIGKFRRSHGTIGEGVIRIERNPGETKTFGYVLDGGTLKVEGVASFRRAASAPGKSGLSGRWTSDQGVDAEVGDDGTLTVIETVVQSGTYAIADGVVTVKLGDGKQEDVGILLDGDAIVVNGTDRLTRPRPAVESVPAPAASTLESVTDAFLARRQQIALVRAEGVGAEHPEMRRLVADAEFLLKRCREEVELLRLDGDEEKAVAAKRRLDLYEAAFRKELQP